MVLREPASKLLTALVAAAAVAAFVLLLWAVGAWHQLELRMRDVRTRWTVPEPGGNPEILLVTVTDESLDEVQERYGHHWPWPWEAYGILFRACERGGSKGILFDFFLIEGREGSQELIAAMQKAPPVYLGVPFVYERRRRESKTPERKRAIERFAIEIDSDGSVDVPTEFQDAFLPPEGLAKAAAGGCAASTPRDSDALIRRYRLFTRFEDRFYPTFALAGLMVREGTRKVTVRNRVVTVGSVSVPVEKDGTFGLRFYRPTDAFAVRDAWHIISGVGHLEETGKIGAYNPETFRGKIVIMGPDAAGMGDLRPTPVGKEVPGCAIHAMALANVLNGDYLRDASAWVMVLFTLAIAGIVAVVTRFASVLVGAGIALAVFGAAMGANVALYKNRWVVELVPQLVTVALAYGAASALNFLYEGRQRLRVKREFQKYLSPKVVEKILRNPDALSMEGERKMLSIFFMDFAGFTSLSETVEPGELVRLVSEYHNEAAEAIFHTEGTLDKFIGDAIMAFWNDPMDQPDHALRACRAAIAAQERLREQVVRMRARGLPEMRARIGLNTGVATVGNMGAKGQVNYTLIGDEVNLASRLEGVNKEFGTEIIVSEATYLPAREHLEVRELALIKVKGKKQAVRIYELLGLRGEVPPERVEAARRFEAAVADFRGRRFSEAKAAFAALPDRASGIYLELCDRYAAEPPPADWDGSYQMDHK